jgi:hypothetical protein
VEEWNGATTDNSDDNNDRCRQAETQASGQEMLKDQQEHTRIFLGHFIERYEGLIEKNRVSRIGFGAVAGKWGWASVHHLLHETQ